MPIGVSIPMQDYLAVVSRATRALCHLSLRADVAAILADYGMPSFEVHPTPFNMTSTSGYTRQQLELVNGKATYSKDAWFWWQDEGSSLLRIYFSITMNTAFARCHTVGPRFEHPSRLGLGWETGGCHVLFQLGWEINHSMLGSYLIC